MRLKLIAEICLAACGATLAAAQPHSRAKPTPPAAPGAILDATELGSPLTLNDDWRVGVSADPNAANADFDDSDWAIRTAQPFISDVDTPSDATNASPEGSQRRYAWFRIHLKLAPNHGPLALLIEVPVSSNTSFGLGPSGPSQIVFANGAEIQPEGPHASDPELFQQISREYELNVPASQTSLTLAVRIPYIAFGLGAYTGFFAHRTLVLGNHDDIARELNLYSDRNLFERLPRLIYSILLTVLALFLFALYFAQKGHVEYLWLALHELAQAPLGFLELAGSTARLERLWYAAIVLQLILISAYLFFEFLVAFLSLPRRWYIRWLRYTAPILAGVGPALLTLLLARHSAGGIVFLVSVFACCILWILGWSLFIFGTLIAAALRRNIEAGLLLIPLVFTVIGLIEPAISSAISEGTGTPYHSPLTVQAGPIPVNMANLGDFAGIFVIVLIIFFRFLRIHREQEHATNELAAARSVQELLIPHEKIATPGFEVESIYNPANEVGGDFFHMQMAEGGMLVVIGDVAGKGLKAAMSVSMIMGALRRAQERSPSKILESLNQVLAGTGSFTTAQAFWFATNGELVVANAGHLPPYLNGQEVTLPGGLPLGVIPQVSYDETRFYLNPGDRILLLSDGVVEARRPSGELFGFDRVRNLSNQTAYYLAEAAKAFGQEDDITVLTVRRAAAQ